MTVSFEVSEDTKTTLLLCARFSQNSQITKSLTQSEFHKLDNLLESQNLSPRNLLGMKPDVLRSICAGQEFISKRINSLLKQT